MTTALPPAPRIAPALLLAAALAVSCLNTSLEFDCRTSAQCVEDGITGVCEPNGYCSFPDITCSSRRRYGRYAAPELAGQCAACGNGKRDPGEECDDGNQSNNDACLTSCRWARCGDGFLRAGVEECDDGNLRDGDGCNGACMRCALGQSAFTWSETNHCYARYDRMLGWDEAERACERDGAHLAVYTSDLESSTVARRLLDGVWGWIGLRDESRTGNFTWVTGEPLNRQTTAWRSGGPRPAGSCLAQTAGESWLGATCTTPHRFVCEQAPWVIRPTDNHAYRAFYGKLSFDKAREACAGYGAHLVTFGDADEHGFVGARFYGTYWIGASRENDQIPFSWVTGERWAYSELLPGEPNVRVNACLVMGEDRKWRDRPCTDAYAFVCEKE